MKKGYLKTFTEIGYRTLIAINIDSHNGFLEPTSLDDDDLAEIDKNMLPNEYREPRDKKIVIKNDVDMTTIEKFYRRTTDTYVYLYREFVNKMTVYNNTVKSYIKEVER